MYRLQGNTCRDYRENLFGLQGNPCWDYRETMLILQGNACRDYRENLLGLQGNPCWDYRDFAEQGLQDCRIFTSKSLNFLNINVKI